MKKAALPLILLLGALTVLTAGGEGEKPSGPVRWEIGKALETRLGNTLSGTLEGMLSLPKTYWLRDSEQAAPRPRPEGWGSAGSPEEMTVPEDFYFGAYTEILAGSEIRYYADETILAVTWKEVHDYGVYTFSEVKIAHPSQLRRFLAGGEYGSDKQFTPSDMAESVNAVVASAGDFYRFRQLGTIVYEGQVRRVDSLLVDTCFVDEEGNLLIARAGEMENEAVAREFVEKNKIRFSLNFGPALIAEGQRCEPGHYLLGEIDEEYARAAICQLGPCHYLLATANKEGPWQHVPDIREFASVLEKTGCETAYALDGGQTAVIVMEGEPVNRVVFGQQRRISDIIYFATALPDGGETWKK